MVELGSEKMTAADAQRRYTHKRPGPDTAPPSGRSESRVLDHLSHSSVNGYMFCPRGWKFGRVDNVPHKIATNLVFGSAFHDTAETRIRSNARAASVPLMACWNTALAGQLKRNSDGLGIDWGDSSPEDMDALGRRMLSATVIRNVIDSIHPLMTIDETTWEAPQLGRFTEGHPAVETLVELQVPHVDIPVVGYVDIITDDGVPGDLKTSSKKWNQNKADKEMQATIYLMALEQMGYTGNPERLFRYFIFTKTRQPAAQILTTQRTQAQFDWTATAIADVYDGIKKGIFSPNCTGWKCSEKWCEFHQHCHTT